MKEENNFYCENYNNDGFADIEEKCKKQCENCKTEAIQALSQSEWISVEDRLPKNNVGVLVFIPIEDNHITSGMYDYDNKWVLLDDYRLIEDDKQITHWMPLPQPPQTK